MNGTNVINDSGNYQSNCAFDIANEPYYRFEQRSSVTDNCGRFWLFGGTPDVYGSNVLNDLWGFDPLQVKWNWIGGSNVLNQTGNYGTLGLASPLNMSPPRHGAVAWWGNDNKFYVFGGAKAGFLPVSDLWVFNPDTNCVPVCATAILAKFKSGDTILCAYDCINFTDLSTNNPTSWQWSFQGGTPSSSTSQNPKYICYFASDSFNVTLIATNANGSDTLSMNNFITVNPSPPTPTITQSHDTLFCSTDSSYVSYQWYEDTMMIPGATNIFYVADSCSNYNVQVTGNNGCKIAVGINIVLRLEDGSCGAGIKDYSSGNLISLSPNPVEKAFTVYGLQFTVSHTEILNVLGQTVQSEQQETRNLKQETTLDVSSLPSGIYFVQLIGAKERWTGRFVKE